MSKRARLALLAWPLVAWAAARPAAAAADDVRNRVLRLLVGYAPASGADVVARVLAQRLQDVFRAGVVVENRPGAGGVLAAQEVARAKPDGSTLLLAAMPQFAILPAIGKVPYSLDRDFEPVSQVVGTDLVLVVNPQRVPVQSMAEFIAWARRQSVLFFGTPGPGTVGHFAAHLVGEATGTAVEPVHFRTTADQATGILNGDIHAQFFSYAAAAPLVRTGKLKVLLTTSPSRSAMFPDAPTPREAGHDNLQFTSWYGVFAPAGTPADVLELLESETVRATRSAQARPRFEEAGLRVTGTSRDEFGRLVRADVERWGRVVKASGFRPS